LCSAHFLPVRYIQGCISTTLLCENTSLFKKVLKTMYLYC